MTYTTLDVRNSNIPKYNFVWCFVLKVWNLVSHIEGRAQIKGAWEQDAEESVWT
jgi:hypothetical protein